MTVLCETIKLVRKVRALYQETSKTQNRKARDGPNSASAEELSLPRLRDYRHLPEPARVSPHNWN